MDSQNKRLLKYMETHKRGITAVDAYEKLGIARLSARIHDLRSVGYNISTYWEEGENRYEEKVRYGRYYLENGS